MRRCHSACFSWWEFKEEYHCVSESSSWRELMEQPDHGLCRSACRSRWEICYMAGNDIALSITEAQL